MWGFVFIVYVKLPLFSIFSIFTVFSASVVFVQRAESENSIYLIHLYEMMHFTSLLLACLTSIAVATPLLPVRQSTSSLWSVTNHVRNQTGPFQEFYTYPYGYYTMTFTLRGSQYSPLGSEFLTTCTGTFDSAALNTTIGNWHTCVDSDVSWRTYYTLSDVDWQGATAPETQVLEVKRKFLAVEEKREYTASAMAEFSVEDGGFPSAFELNEQAIVVV